MTLMWSQWFAHITDAIAAERQVKGWSRAKKQALMRGDFDALRTLAQQTARTISNPRALAQTYRRSLALDRRYHRRTRRILGRPTGTPVRANGDVGSAAGGPAMPGFPTEAAASPGGGRWVWQPAWGAAPPAPAMLPQTGATCPACGR